MPLYCSSGCGFPGTLWVGAFLVVAFSHLHASLISGTDPPCSETGAEGGKLLRAQGQLTGAGLFVLMLFL